MHWALGATLLALLWLPVAAADPGPGNGEIRIGVLSHRGDAITERMWTPTADYLTRALPDQRFRIVPLDFTQVDPAVRDARVDFVLVNPGIYVNLEVRHRVSRIATMQNRVGLVRSNVFGGVVFTRADHPGLTRLEDLRGRSLLAVDRDSLGGFQMAWGELLERGVDPDLDLARLDFAGTHDAVVLAVGRGDYDAGTVRTDILEQMDARGLSASRTTASSTLKRTPSFPSCAAPPCSPSGPSASCATPTPSWPSGWPSPCSRCRWTTRRPGPGAMPAGPCPWTTSRCTSCCGACACPPTTSPAPSPSRRPIARYWLGCCWAY
jgi:ABC-type phosphate/phosphonate transport system substrate-binding protein